MNDTSPDELIRQEADLIESGLTLQAQCLNLLLAEMQALARVIPVVAAVPAAKSDSETEADFDNMPV
jgi:hypothetical protein